MVSSTKIRLTDLSTTQVGRALAAQHLIANTQPGELATEEERMKYTKFVPMGLMLVAVALPATAQDEAPQQTPDHRRKYL